jgi:glycosyltransferase involved in cell wall biosynthesis
VAATADVTVVLCSRNRPELLERALARINQVTPADTRVLVVDSASSTPRTRDVALAAGVDVVRSDVPGLSIARNLGLATADRPYVVYTDDDCEPVEGWIEHVVAPFDDEAVGAVTGLLLDQSRIGLPHSEDQVRFTSIRRGLDAGHGALMAFRREMLVRLGGFDDLLGAGRRFAGSEDLDMFCRVLATGSAIVHEPRSVVHHMNTREDDEYAELLHGYGLGLGGLLTKWVRLAPATGLGLSVLAYGRTGVRLTQRLGSRRGRRGQLAMLRGMVAGMAISSRFAMTGSRFVDEHPPEPTPIDEAGRSAP